MAVCNTVVEKTSEVATRGSIPSRSIRFDQVVKLEYTRRSDRRAIGLESSNLSLVTEGWAVSQNTNHAFFISRNALAYAG